MTEAALLEHSRTWVQRLNLPPMLNWGDPWLVALTCGPTDTHAEEARFDQALADYRHHFRSDVVQFYSQHPEGTTRCLLLILGSPGMAHWLEHGPEGFGGDGEVKERGGG